MGNRSLIKLRGQHRQLARLIVGGNSQSECARLLGIHKSTVSRLMNDPLVAQEIERLQDVAEREVSEGLPGISAELKKHARRSVEVLAEILDDPRREPEIIRLKTNAANSLLDRAGLAPVKYVQVDQRSMSTHFNREEIEEIKRRGLKALEEERRRDAELEELRGKCARLGSLE